MEEEEESEENREIERVITMKEKEELKSPSKLAQHLSRYKIITKDMVLKILVKNSKTRTDVENRIIADYLSKNYDYFQKIKETSHKRFLKLISVLSFETYLPNELIININFDEDKFFIVFEGSVFVYRLSFYEKEMKLGDFCNYLYYVKKKDDKQYTRLINQNKNLGINFEGITENPYFNKFKMKKFIFTIEELEEIGKFSNGYVFGEMNLIRKKKKDILVKTVTKTQVISVSKFDFNRILKTIEEKRLELLSEKFRKRFNMFRYWSMEQLITLFNYCSYAVFHKEDYIYKQNEPSHYIYFIEKGKFEQYCNTSFSWYKNYIDYIGSLKDNLINIMLSKNPENFKQLREIYEEELERQNKKDKLISSNNIPNLFFLNMKNIYIEKKKPLEKYLKTDNLYYIKKEEEELNDPNRIIKIPVLTTEMPRVIGIEEAFEFKRRFTTVKCLSGKIVAKKINIYDLLKLLLLYKEFKYAEKFLNLLVQKKIVLIDTIKMHLKKNARRFEKDIDIKYEELIAQNDDSNKIVAAAKLKGWNNGLYLDNILDNSLHFFEPKSEKIINTEKEKRYNIVHNLLHQKPEKNTKRANKIVLNISRQNNKQPFLVTERRDFFSPKENLKEEMKNKIKNVKCFINSYSNKKLDKNKIMSKITKLGDDSDLYDIEKKIRKPSSLINKKSLLNNINLETKRLTINKHMTPINSRRLFGNIEEDISMLFGEKINKIKNKKKVSNNDNSNSSNKFFVSKTIYSNSMGNSHKDKKNKNSNISILTNKLESYCNHKESFTKESRDKNRNILPCITLNSDRNNNNLNIGIKKGFIINNPKNK